MATNDISITIRTNSEIKKQAQGLFNDLGLDMSTAVNMFLRQSVRESRIPFSITKNTNTETYSAIKDAATNHNLSGPFHDFDEIMEHVNA